MGSTRTHVPGEVGYAVRSEIDRTEVDKEDLVTVERQVGNRECCVLLPSKKSYEMPESCRPLLLPHRIPIVSFRSLAQSVRYCLGSNGRCWHAGGSIRRGGHVALGSESRADNDWAARSGIEGQMVKVDMVGKLRPGSGPEQRRETGDGGTSKVLYRQVGSTEM